MITREQLELHTKWARGETGGVQLILRGADLRGADLEGADLEGADLGGADLRGAYLRGAYLRGADLRGAYLRGADLRRAYLRGADLRRAYLRRADLEGAYLEGADLEGADLRGAKVSEEWKVAPGVYPHSIFCMIGRWILARTAPDRVKIGCTELSVSEWLGAQGRELAESHKLASWEVEAIRAWVSIDPSDLLQPVETV